MADEGVDGARASAGFAEFTRLAAAVGMPVSERRTILGLMPATAQNWHTGVLALPDPSPPNVLRRLNYVLPLMRRLAADQTP